MKTKKKALFFGIFTAIILSLSITTQATARTTVWGWKTVPFTDPANDVYQYLPTQFPWEGVKVNHQPGIDIVLVDVQGTEFIIACSSPPPLIDPDYNYTIDIDNNADDLAEFIIFWYPSEGFVLQRYSDGEYWNTGGWEETPESFSTDVTGNNLSIFISGDPIANLASARFAVTSTYTGNGTYLFLDYAPDHEGESGWMVFLIILFPVIGAVIAAYILYKKRHVIFD